jgi:GxxExxY protein
MRADERDPLTERIIACALQVHRTLGPGLLENTYHGALAIELQHQGFTVERERLFPAFYRGIKVGDYRPDLIVDGEVVIEVKSVAAYDPVFMAQMLTYLRVTGITVGLILNFNRRVLRDGIKRVIL